MMKKKIVGIIPVRYASTRFPGKPLADIGGKTMVRRVYEQALKSKFLNKVIVATDDERIYEEVQTFGGEVQMTLSTHANGTERCCEVASMLDCDVVINIQGDEPFIEPEQIDLLCQCFEDDAVQIATLVRPFSGEEEFANPARVKAILDENFDVVSFRRNYDSVDNVYKHIGLYGFRKEVLIELVKLEPTESEMAENLEQLRWLENDYKITCVLTTHESKAVDTPEDLAELLRWYNANKKSN
jgi:3-deoxy-manno-octulosonate cytidylyltransferase (CMP-KDO synthetase)